MARDRLKVSKAVLFAAKTSFGEEFYRSSFERAVESSVVAVGSIYDSLHLKLPVSPSVAELIAGLPVPHQPDYDLVDEVRLRFGRFAGARDSEDFADEKDAVALVIKLTEKLIEACEEIVRAISGS